ncbi:hypothetical protein ACLBKU_06425 [Erythrobacter sp. NE805]|uniref:hypothetical protein n=1 Tax=Erythrobacter sp. NE805 TaxID=3389875 RepID=UPI00396B2437
MTKSIRQFLIEQSENCVVTDFAGGLAIRAVSHDEVDLRRFQHIVREIIDGAGDVYSIPVRPHFSSSYSVDYCDVVLIEWLK